MPADVDHRADIYSLGVVFYELLTGQSLDHVERGRGRFRSYLLGAVKHFLADRYDRARAAKRGGGGVPISLDAVSCAGGDPADAAGFPPDAFFDRQWAVNLLDRVLAALTREHEQSGKRAELETLKPYLTADAAALTPADAAARLSISTGAAKVAIHRLRKRFRQLVQAEIAATVVAAAEIAAEMDYLIQALSHADAD